MSDEHFTRAPPLDCRLMSASMEIDDDDEDVIQVSIEVANEAAMPIGGLDIFIQTSDNRKVESAEGISSLGPGLTRKFTFEFPLQSGDWTFMLRSPTVKADLGPYNHDFTYQAEKGRVYNNAIGTGMSLFEAAVVTSLGMVTAYQIPIPEIKPFITVILILLWVAAASALILLPAVLVTLEKMGIGSVSDSNMMARKLGLIMPKKADIDVLDAVIVDEVKDAW